MPLKIVIAGGGAAGFFAAITCAENNPKAEVVILERGKKVLEKVKISGGGRCNLTHACFDPKELINFYPRGSKALLGPFHQFCSGDTVDWFEKRGVETKIEEDGRMFPITDDSQTIIDCLMESAKAAGVKILMQTRVEKIIPPDLSIEKWQIDIGSNELLQADKLMIATGSNPKIWQLLENLGHTIIKPVPSLFTFNIKDPRIEGLAGLAVKNATVTIPNSKLQASGPLLITHWGMSGPVILKLSAFGARMLADKNYEFSIQVNWVNEKNNTIVFDHLTSLSSEHHKKMVSNIRPYNLQERLWLYLLERCDISPEKRWGDLGNKSLNKLVNIFTNDIYQVKGKTTFKEEFVTCGGVSLSSIDLATMQSKVCKNLYFAGEVMDIDAITGGYNFQAAWTTAFIAGKLA